MNSATKKLSKMFIISGIVGLSVHVALNLIAIFILKKPEATYFTNEWFSTWFPSLVVWPVLLISGLGLSCKCTKTATDNSN